MEFFSTNNSSLHFTFFSIMLLFFLIFSAIICIVIVPFKIVECQVVKGKLQGVSLFLSIIRIKYYTYLLIS